jgi:hypothetical protein
MNIEIKTTDGTLALVNWDNVDYVRVVNSYFGEKYNEIYFAGKRTPITTKETIAEIKKKLTL